MATPLPGRDALLGSVDTLKQYDAVLLPCQSDEDYTEAEATALKAYADQGGRLFNTHHGGQWMFRPTNHYAGMVAFDKQPDFGGTTALVDTTFAKGATFAKWLSIVGASSTEGQIPISAPQHFVDGVSAPAQRWVYTSSPTTIQHFTFNAPTTAPEAQQCGRVLYSNFHVSGASAGTFPGVCASGPLTKDEQIVEYMLFDVTACVKPDSGPK